MTRSIVVLFTAATLLFSAAGYSAEPTSPGAKASMVFKDSKYNFRVEVPDTWDLQEGYAEQNLDFVMIALSPEEGAGDKFVENMNILVDGIGKTMTSQEYFEQNLRGVMSDLPNVSMDEKGDVTINGVTMYRAVYTWSGDSSKITTYQFIFVKGDKGYVMTFTTEPTSFQRYRAVFDNIASTFAFNP